MHEIHVLTYSTLELDSSFLVASRYPGVTATCPVLGLLVLGNPAGPILIDTGSRGPDMMARIGMVEHIADDQGIENQLGAHGLELGDVAMVVHTHLHMDHAGKTDLFPMTTPVVLNRRELEISAGGIAGVGYPPEDVKHLIDRVHAPGAITLLDLEQSGPVHIAQGIRCELAGAHTAGSLNLHIATDEGNAVVCGDVVYDIHNQCVEPWVQNMRLEPQIAGHRYESSIAEKAGIKKVLEQADWLLPLHDARPARVDAIGAVTGRVEGTVVPGPVTPVATASNATHAVPA